MDPHGPSDSRVAADARRASDPRATYESRHARFDAERAGWSRRSRWASHGRLAAFLLLIGAGVWSELRPGPLPLLAAGFLLVAFVFLVLLHGRYRARERWSETLAEVNAEGLLRLDRDWERLPAPPLSAPPDHAYAQDLDLFGRPGLVQLLGPTSTPAGATTLRDWLLEPAQPARVRERQEAVRELKDVNDLRDDVAAHGRLGERASPGELESFLAWSREPTTSTVAPVWTWIARVLPLLTVAAIVVDLAEPGGPHLWAVTAGAAAALSFAAPGGRVRAMFHAAFGREGIFRRYPELFEAVGRAELRAPALTRLQAELGASGAAAHEHMRRLRSLMHLADLRHSTMIYLPLQLVLLWDFHVAAAVDRWRRDAGRFTTRWIGALAEVEALCALAALAHDEPEWSFAEIELGAAAFEAERLGHPMLPRSRRVDNDVTVGPPGTFLLVTGSNMSGKSTLLRSVGLNTVLALAGAPACAARLRLPPVSLHTAIHVEDSLVRGISLFMAQLHRMKRIVEAADASAGSPVRLLYLLDEILQGTNTEERRVAATRVIRHLLDTGAIGAVTTHDLHLAREPSLAEAALAVHFRETVHTEDGGPLMTFDYRLRPGVATSTNALKLMALVGLGEESEL